MARAAEGWVGFAACKEAVPEANTIPKVMGRHRKPPSESLRTERRTQPLALLSGSFPPASLPHSIPRAPSTPCSRRAFKEPQVSLSKGLWDPGGEGVKLCEPPGYSHRRGRTDTCNEVKVCDGAGITRVMYKQVLVGRGQGMSLADTRDQPHGMCVGQTWAGRATHS